MTTKKAALRSTELDVARCEARWSDIPERARKYRKHNHDRGDVEKTVLAEMLLFKARTSSDTDGSKYLDDGPSSISLPPPLPAEELALVEALLVEASAGVTDPARLEPIHIVHARALCFAQEYQRSLDILQTISSPTLPEDGSTPTGYAVVLAIQRQAVHAIVLEQLGHIDEACALHNTLRQTLFPLSHLTISASLTEWAEEALYRAPFLHMRQGRHNEAIEAFRAYHAFMLHSAMWLPGFRLHKRFAIIRHFSQQLASLHARGQYYPPMTEMVVSLSDTPLEDSQNPTSIPVSEAVPHEPTFPEELGLIDAIYEELTHLTHTFPKSRDPSNWRVLEMCDTLVRHHRLIGDAALAARMTIVTLSARLLHQKRRRALVEALYRATELTFHSAHITRLLAYALVDLGEYDEAAMAVKAYHALTLDRGNVVSRRESLLILPDDQPSAAPALSMCIGEVETTTHIVGTLLLGAHLALGPSERTPPSGHSAADGEEEDGEGASPLARALLALRYTDRAQAMCEDVRATPHAVSPRLLSHIALLSGRALGRRARQAISPHDRSTYHARAIQALEEACSLDGSSGPAHHYLAQEHALSRSIPAAIVAAKAAVRILSHASSSPSHAISPLPTAPPQGSSTDVRSVVEDIALRYLHEEALLVQSWHLLTLLMSAQKMDLPALRLSSMPAKESAWEIPPHHDTTDPTGPDHLPPTPPTTTAEGEEVLLAQGGPEEGEALLAAEMTAARLIGRVEGPASGLRRHADLFRLYGRVYASEVSGGGVGVGSEVGAGAGGAQSFGSGTKARSQTGPTYLGVGSPHAGGGSRSGAPSVNGSFRSASFNSPGSTARIRTLPVAYASSVAASIPSAPTHLPLPSEHGSRPATLSVYGLDPSLAPSPGLSARSVYAPALRVTSRVQARRQRALHALTSLWLLSAEAYRQLGRFAEAWEAIEEAEGADGESAAVFCQMGMLYLAEGRVKESQGAFVKALSLESRHIPSMVQLGRAYLAHTTNPDGPALAEGLLLSATEGEGWDCAEAWLWLGKTYQLTGRIAKAKEALWYALELEGTEPVRSFMDLGHDRP